MSTASDTQDVKCGIEQGGARMFVKSGAELDIEAGGAFKIAGVAVTASAADLNQIAGDAAGPQKFSFADALTAHSGGGQGSALALTKTINRLTTVAAQGDSVALPAAVPGTICYVINKGANAAQVFGNGTDTINLIATATGVSQGVGTFAKYACTVAGNWEVPLSDLWSSFPSPIAANGAVPAHAGHVYVVTKAGVCAMTLAAPTAGADDGLEITLTSNTAFAHTLTATGLFQCGTAAVNLATFAAQAGAGLTLMAYGGKWNVVASVGITFS